MNRRILTLLALFLVAGVALGFAAKKKQRAAKPKTMNTEIKAPDFAYPQTVIADATTALREASAAGNGAETVKAALQLVIANDCISAERAPQMAELLDSVARLQPQPWSSLLYSIEAQVYKEIYQNDIYTFNNRNVPLSSASLPPTEWSRDLFALKVLGLAEKSIASGELAGIPLSDLSSLLTGGSEGYETYYPTALDFLSYRAVELLSPFAGSGSVIPFGATSGKRSVADRIRTFCDSTIDGLVGMHEAKGNLAATAVSVAAKADRCSTAEESRKVIECALKDMQGSEYSALLLAELGGYMPESENRSYYERVENACSQYPEYKYIGRLRRIAARLSAQSAAATAPKQVLSTDSIEASVDVANNRLFYLLLVRIDDRTNGSVKLNDIIAHGKVMESIAVENDSTVPFKAKQKLKFAPQAYGTYVLLTSATPNLSGVYRTEGSSEYYDFFRVSDMTAIVSYSHTDRKSGRVYVVEGRNQKPVEGAKVAFAERAGRNGRSTTLTTNKEGYVDVPYTDFSAKITKGADRCAIDSWSYFWEKTQPQKQGTILTDLSVYHPGDTVRFSFIGWEEREQRLSALKDYKVKFELRDANGERVDTLRLVTDDAGRVAGKFRLPKEGLLGRFSIAALNPEGETGIGYGSFEVAEYKAPTFYVQIDSIPDNYKIGDTVKITGKAMTYSGMPLAGADVAYTVNYEPLWWRTAGEAADCSYAAETQTGADGTFCIELPTERLKNTPFVWGLYTLQATVTSGAGETQQSEKVPFTLCDAYRIAPSVPSKICASGKELKYKVSVVDILGNSAAKNVEYTIVNDSDSVEVAKGEFTAPDFDYDLGQLPSGRYSLKFMLPGDDESEEEVATVIWRKSDSKPPYSSKLWVPETRYYAGSKPVKVKLGSSYADSYILAELADADGFLWRKWLHVDARNCEVEVPAPADNNRCYLVLTAIRDLSSERATVTIMPGVAAEELKVEVKSFRNKLIPGAAEKWEFQVLFGDSPVPHAPVIAVLNNKALSAIAPFNWEFSPEVIFSNPVQTDLRYIGLARYWYKFAATPQYKVPELTMPYLNTWSYSLTGPAVYYKFYSTKALAGSMDGVKIRGNSHVMAKEESVEEDAAEAEPLMLNEVVTAMGVAPKSSEAEGSDAGQEIALRSAEMPLAFFKPDLTADADGNVTIGFEVPDFNTTWTFKLVSYDGQMRSSLIALEAVAAKPVMVSCNLPRFVRTGDSMTLRATLMNATDSVRPVAGRIELFDPISGEVLKKYEYEAADLGPKGSRVIEFPLSVADDMEFIGVRSYAISGEYSDGEQSQLAVLPSSTPVTESTPFYVDPGKSIEVTLPDFGADARLTLKYCDNPVWYCLTALPDISDPESGSLTALIYAFYGNVMTAGMLKQYPEIGKALDYWRTHPADSMLVSNLQRDTALKILALGNTPWVNNAASETLRMERLASLADKAVDSEAVSGLMTRIAALQNSDGGWSWCPGMKSSVFMTGLVLETSGMLAQAGYLPAEKKFIGMLSSGAAFYEREAVKEARRLGKDFNPEVLMDYLLSMSYLSGSGVKTDVAGFASLSKKCISAVRSGWKHYTVPNAARGALLLSRNGYPMAARSILESLRQRSLSKSGRGVWFDNITSGYAGYWRLGATSDVLRAFAEILPSDTVMIDGLRQWLLTERQVQDWGASRFTADVIQAILSSGTKWIKSSSPARISLDGKPLDLSAAPYTGEITVSLDPKQTSGAKLSIDREGASPAWGAVVGQWIAPMQEVKAASIEGFSIRKEVLIVRDTDDGTVVEPGDMQVGDRIRIMLTVTSDRDLDYVAISDARAAFMEPADQTAGYELSDGVGVYTEPCRSATNIFIDHLPKGTRIFTYDCFASQQGDFAAGIAQIQSFYAPAVTAHSAGARIEVAR